MARLKLTLLTLIALFFAFFGINLLISAYRLNDPFAFILTFFASNLIILISVALCLGFILRLRQLLKSKEAGRRKPTHTP